MSSPKIKIREALPKQLERNRFSVVHITFTRILSNNAVHHDRLFPFAKPARLPTKPTGGLARSGRHENEGEESDKECKEALNTSQDKRRQS
jgi:hypothetical protein